jgi:hypothetical protein
VHVIGHGLDRGEMLPRAGAFRAAHAIPVEAFLVAFVGSSPLTRAIDVLLRGSTGFRRRHGPAAGWSRI